MRKSLRFDIYKQNTLSVILSACMIFDMLKIHLITPSLSSLVCFRMKFTVIRYYRRFYLAELIDEKEAATNHAWKKRGRVALAWPEPVLFRGQPEKQADWKL